MHAGSKHGRIVRTLSCVSSRISGCESNNFSMTWLPLNAADMSGVQPKPPYRERQTAMFMFSSQNKAVPVDVISSQR